MFQPYVEGLPGDDLPLLHSGPDHSSSGGPGGRDGGTTLVGGGGGGEDAYVEVDGGGDVREVDDGREQNTREGLQNERSDADRREALEEEEVRDEKDTKQEKKGERTLSVPYPRYMNTNNQKYN